MNRLIASTNKAGMSAIVKPRLNFMLGEEEKTINHFITYLEESGQAFPSDYLLSTLISKIETVGGETILELYDAVQDRLFDLANAAKISNPTKGWSPTYSEHYPFTYEYWNVASLTPRSTIETLVNDPYGLMEMLRPISVVAHPYTHDSDYLPIADHSASKSEAAGAAFILIDIPALAVHYRLWKENVQALQEEGMAHTSGKFITGYVVSRMLKSSFDAAIVNSQIDLLLATRPHLEGEGLVVGSRRFNDIAYEVSEWGLQLGNRNLKFGQVLKAIPSVEMLVNQHDRLTRETFTAANAHVILAADLRRLAMDLAINPMPAAKSSLLAHMRRMERDWKNYQVEKDLPYEVAEEAEGLFSYVKMAINA